MKLSDLLENIEVQGEYKVVYFDEDKCERVDVTSAEASEWTVNYMYPESDCIYIEVEKD